MSQTIVFKIADILEKIKQFKHAPEDINIHEYYLGVSLVYMTEIFTELGYRFQADYLWEGSYIDTDGVRWIKYAFHNPEDAMMIKIRGIGVHES